jgi:hypothetical protein
MHPQIKKDFRFRKSRKYYFYISDLASAPAIAAASAATASAIGAASKNATVVGSSR